MKLVRLAICRTTRAAPARAAPARARTAALPDLAPAGVSWLKFGEHTVYCGGAKPWGHFKDRASRAGLALREHPQEVDRERLHVVIQKGRLFQREHPDVPVLLDKGRFLLVDLAPSRARKIGKSDVPCFAVQPVDALQSTRAEGRHRVVFEGAARAAAAAVPDPAIQALVNKIARPSYEATLTRLVGFNTRNSITPQF